MVILFLIGIFAVRTSTHTITSIEIPRWADPRRDAELRCEYTRLPNDPPLHSVKWYRGMHEVLRYTPQEFETLIFNTSGLVVVNSSCDVRACVVIARPGPGGAVYICEVSSEGPRFAVDRRQANMTLAVLPEYDPLITGLPTMVQAGESAVINCTSDYSLPAATIDWFVDAEPQEDPIIVSPLHISSADGDGLQASWRTLHVYPDDYATHRGYLAVRCRATIATEPPHVASMSVRLHVAARPHISTYMFSKNSKLGRRLRANGEGAHAESYLVQRIALAIQRGNAACIMGTFPSDAVSHSASSQTFKKDLNITNWTFFLLLLVCECLY